MLRSTKKTKLNCYDLLLREIPVKLYVITEATHDGNIILCHWRNAFQTSQRGSEERSIPMSITRWLIRHPTHTVA
ncbi:hypothetical protein J6590_027452 [Homalodisca vitripennis]|nr:hypothetical protein J6590_027452 [Homalodisca vitripennis]